LLVRLKQFVLLCCTLPVLAPLAAADTYQAHFQARFDPATGLAHASIRIEQDSALAREVTLAIPHQRYSAFEGDGEIEQEGNRLAWKVPADGGELRYEFKVDQRKGKAYDARMTASWAILRLDDLFPPARVRSLKGAYSESTLRLRGPEGWVFETRYGPLASRLELPESDRAFTRPTGWLAAGVLGIRREIIANRRVALAGPPGQGMRRLDTLAFLRWTMPRLVKIFDEFPDRLLIVGARDKMWRGGLSGPSSLYLHTQRPIISENATSTVLHELMHVATSSATERDDWLVEGMAEYYSLEILRRSGGISRKRFDQTMQTLADWVEREDGKLRSPSKGADTARAVLLLWNLAEELRQTEAGNLDSIIREVADSGVITGKHLLTLTEAAIGGQSALLRKAMAE
jgi:hypothetical protein